MLMRIFLIIALVGGLAAAGINLFVVKDKIVTTVKERDDFHTERDKEAEDKRKAQKDAKDTHATLDKTKEELTSTQKERDDAVTEAGKQKQIATKVSEELAKTHRSATTPGRTSRPGMVWGSRSTKSGRSSRS